MPVKGWDACEDELRLTGWTQRRRVIVMRRVRKTDLVVEVKRAGRPKGKDQVQAELHFIDENEPPQAAQCGGTHDQPWRAEEDPADHHA